MKPSSSSILGLSAALCVSFSTSVASGVEPVLSAPESEGGCLALFTADYTRDSFASTFNDASVAPESLAERLEDARRLVEVAAARLGCGAGAVRLRREEGEGACMALVPRDPSSISCYVPSSIGYFFVTRDMLENATVVFNRWD